ncbi:MAG: glycosyltransferase family 39 protein [Opitutaceae bacterium]
MPDSEPASTSRGTRLALGAGILAYAALLWALIGAVPGGSDNSGYFNEARLFAQGRIHTPMRTLAGIPAQEVPFLYVPLGFRPAGAAQLVPTYPPGLPLLLVPAARLVGWERAGDVILILHSLAGLALMFALGRLCGLPGSWALAGAAVLAASPLYLYTSLQALSDVPATAWATAAVVAALKSRGQSGWAFACGVCIAVGFLVRPTNFLVAIPVLFALGCSPARLGLAALGALPGLAAWMAINHAAYGQTLESGYGAIGNEFHAGLIPATLVFYARWLPLLLSPIVLAAPFVLALGRAGGRIAWMLVSWAACFLAFYCAYRWTREQWWFLRFVLPAAPALIVAGLAALRHLFEKGGGPSGGARRWLVPALVLVAALGVEASQTNPLREARWIGSGERKYGRVADWLETHVPADSVLVVSQASGALYYYTGFTLLREEELSPAIADRVRASARAGGHGLFAVLWPHEKEVLRKLPGTWAQIGSIEDVTVWRCGAEAPLPGGK